MLFEEGEDAARITWKVIGACDKLQRKFGGM
jgi:hypothetical protein